MATIIVTILTTAVVGFVGLTANVNPQPANSVQLQAQPVVLQGGSVQLQPAINVNN